MSDIGKVTPDRPVIPPVPQDRPVGEREERERRRREREQENGETLDGDGEEGIDVYV